MQVVNGGQYSTPRQTRTLPRDLAVEFSITNQMENPKPDWTQGSGSALGVGLMDRVVDANGNETFLNYTFDHGMLYLTNILYNANLNSPALAASHEVDFILTNRADTNFTYISNYRVEMDKLLSEIDVRAGGQNVRKYVLGYTNSPSTLRSLLASVTQYGSDFTTHLPPITFGYQVESLTFGPDINWPGVYSQGDTGVIWNAIRATDGSDDVYVNMIDVDGDGLPRSRNARIQWSSLYELFCSSTQYGIRLCSGSG